MTGYFPGSYRSGSLGFSVNSVWSPNCSKGVLAFDPLSSKALVLRDSCFFVRVFPVRPDLHHPPLQGFIPLKQLDSRAGVSAVLLTAV